MKIFKIIAWSLLLAIVAIQFFPTDRNQSDVVPKSDFLLVNNTPQSICTILKESCYDCHSNNTEYPWYNKTQPAAWFLEDHVKHAKGELNFNTWDELTDRRKKSKLKSIISQVKDDEMPLSSYVFIHRNAAFSEAEKQSVIQYITQLKDSLSN